MAAASLNWVARQRLDHLAGHRVGELVNGHHGAELDALSHCETPFDHVAVGLGPVPAMAPARSSSSPEHKSSVDKDNTHSSTSTHNIVTAGAPIKPVGSAQAAPPPFVPPPFDRSFQAIWSGKDAVLEDDHADSLQEQLFNYEAQPYEHPYYGLFPSTTIPYVSTFYTTSNRAKSRLRLEWTSQARLVYATTFTSAQREEIDDPTMPTPPSSVAASIASTNPDPPPRRLLLSQNELRDLRINEQNLRFKTKKPRRPPRDRSGASVQNEGAQSDDKQSSSSKPETPPPGQPDVPHERESRRPKKLVRIADSMVYARERLASLAHGKRPCGSSQLRPVLVVEVKVPAWPETIPKASWRIQDYIASTCIDEAMPQIVQQAQLAFHTYPAISTVWGSGVAGPWIRFFRFSRNKTPEIDLRSITVHDPYFPVGGTSQGQLMAKAVPEYTSDLMAFMDDDDGYYTDSFKRYWHLAVLTAEEQFDDDEPLASEAAEERDDRLFREIVGSDIPVAGTVVEQ